MNSVDEADEAIRLADVLPGLSARLGPEDAEHSRPLASVAATLPPILVHRQTMKVIDGCHRVQAAILNGATSIWVRFFDGTLDDTFVEAVRSNVAHGKPLTIA